MKKCKILFFAANPTGTPQLLLDEEIRDIGQKIRGSDNRDALQLITNWATRPDDLLQSLNEHCPHIVHFSGHGSASEEIILQNSSRTAKPVTKAALKQLFATLKDNIRVVVLNACYSHAQAEAITEVIDCVIGMKGSIGDQAAITFAASFYRAIGFGRSVQDAFYQGKTALMLEGIAEEDTPQLLRRAGVDPSQIYLTTNNRDVIATLEFTLDQGVSEFDPAKFIAALHHCAGVNVTNVHIVSIRSGSTKVKIAGPIYIGSS